MSIIYFPHSTTRDNAMGVRSGWSDPPLSAIGRRQARELALVTMRSQFDEVYCSDLARAVQTAEIAFHNYDVRFDSRLREMNYGELNGAHETVFPPEADFIDVSYEGGESCLEVEARVRELLGEIDPSKKVAVVSHKFPQLAIEVICNGVSWQNALENDWRSTGAWRPGWTYTLV